ncbi:MAG: Ig domain-containing protein, partial [bacterium]|nr:Ig domain-containing protein [bacterium]
ATDTTAPTVVSIERHDGTNAQDALTNADTLTFRVTFSEAVEKVGIVDFDASGTTGDASIVEGLSQGTTRIVTVSGGNLESFNGTVGLTFASGVTIDDLAGNALNATLPTGANYETYTLDNMAPGVALNAPDNHDGSTAFNVTVTFGEDVSDFDDAADVTVTGGTLTGGANGITSNSATSYTVSVTPSGTVSVTVQVPAGAATDDAGNGNLASATATVAHVGTDPATAAEGNEVVWEYPEGARFGRDANLACLREGETSGAFTATLSAQPTQNVRAEIHELYQNPDPGLGGGLIVAVNGAGSALGALTFTAANWDTPQYFYFRMPQDDDAAAQTAGFAFRTTSDDADWNGSQSLQVDICAGDDDLPGWSVTPGDLSGGDGDTVTYQIGPKTQPLGSIRLSLTAANDDANGVVSPGTLTFRYNDWTPKTVRVTLSADTDTDNGTVTVTHTPRRASVHEPSYSYPVDVSVRHIEAGFSLDTPPDLRFRAGDTIVPTRLPAATGGTPPYTYTATGLPTGLSFDGDTRAISGKPSAATTSAATVTYTARDSAGTAATATATFTVDVDAATDVIWETTMTVGTASHDFFGRWWGYCSRYAGCFGGYGSLGNGSFVFDGDPNEVVDLKWNGGSLILRLSEKVVRSEMLGWTLIIDGHAIGFRGAIFGRNSAGSRKVQFDNFWGRAPRPAAGQQVPVKIVKREGPSLPANAPLALEAPANPTWEAGKPGRLHLPQAAGGTPDTWRFPQYEGLYYYTLTQPTGAALPDWMKFNESHAVLTGTPTAQARDTRLTYTAADGLDVTRSVDFTVHVAVEVADIDDQDWNTSTAVNLELPEATGGALPFTYSLSGTLPAGLTFNREARPPTITGTPSAAAASTTLTYTATDADGASKAVTFDAAVTADVDATLTFGQMAYTFVENQLSGLITITVDNAVTGGFTVTPTLTPTYGDHVLQSVNYLNLSDLTFAGTAGESETLQLQLSDDSVADLPETYDLALAVDNDRIDATDTATLT